MTEEPRDPRRETRDARTTDGRPNGPVGTVLGATLGPFGWAIGGVVGQDRLALKFSVGTGSTSDRDDGVTVEIDDETVETGSDGADGSGDGSGDADRSV